VSVSCFDSLDGNLRKSPEISEAPLTSTSHVGQQRSESSD
jgi:hypothetical protein